MTPAPAERSFFARPVPLVCLLLLLTAIPIGVAIERMIVLPFGTLPPEAAKFYDTPVALWLHAAGGALFGLLGPVQFAGVLRRRFRLHKITGRVFALCGFAMALSSLRLLYEFPGASTPVLDIARLLAALALFAALVLAIDAARSRRIDQHRAWMIRAYAIGMGAATVSLILFPIYVITGEAPTGLASDAVFVASWLVNIIIAEWVIRGPRAAALKGVTP